MYSSSPLQKQFVIVDTTTGVVVAQPTQTTERSAFLTAYADAKEWAEDAVLRYIEADSISVEGLVETWLIGFYSASLEQVLMIEVSGTATTVNEYVPQTLPEQWSTEGDIVEWLESSEAVSSANDVLGDDLIAAGVVNFISAVLTYTTPPERATLAGSAKAGSPQALWLISYHNVNGETRTVYVGNGITAVSTADDSSMPSTFSLLQNYPNPFNPSTTIQYAIPVQSKVSLEVFDVLGRKVAIPVDRVQRAQPYKVHWDATHMASGIYLYRLEVIPRHKSSDRTVFVKSMFLIK